MMDTTTHLLNLAITLAMAVPVVLWYRKTVSQPEHRYFTFGPRFWTGFVDSSVLWSVAFALTAVLVLDLPDYLVAAVAGLRSIVWLIYTVEMHSRFGQTVGKMVTKVRVVDFESEEPITRKQALMRESVPMLLSLGFIGYEIQRALSGNTTPGVGVTEAVRQSGAAAFLALLPALWFVAEALTMLTNEKRRAIHDYIAGTVVIRTNV